MAHEELKEQYEEDCKNYERPWELWQWRRVTNGGWVDFEYIGPKWRSDCEYRRKGPPFQPEYFSGLNWRESEHVPVQD